MSGIKKCLHVKTGSFKQKKLCNIYKEYTKTNRGYIISVLQILYHTCSYFATLTQVPFQYHKTVIDDENAGVNTMNWTPKIVFFRLQTHLIEVVLCHL